MSESRELSKAVSKAGSKAAIERVSNTVIKAVIIISAVCLVSRNVVEAVAFLKRWVEVGFQKVTWDTESSEPREPPVVWSGHGT